MPILFVSEEGFAEGGVAEDDGLPEIPVRIDELVADPEKVLRRLSGEGDPRPEPRVDKEVSLRFVIEGEGGEEIGGDPPGSRFRRGHRRG